MQDGKDMSGQPHITRARAVIVHQGQVLLMKRTKPELTYFTLIGGKVEPDETPEQAVIREVFEECGVTVRLEREIHRDFDIFNGVQNIHLLYLCTYLEGTPVLGGEERERSTLENQYEPLWIDANQLDELTIRPEWQAPIIRALFHTVIKETP